MFTSITSVVDKDLSTALLAGRRKRSQPNTPFEDKRVIVLLGTGDSGKSTFLKTLYLEYDKLNQFATPTDMNNTLIENMVYVVTTVLKYCEKNKISLSKNYDLTEIHNLDQNNLFQDGEKLFTKKIYQAIQVLIQDSVFRETLHKIHHKIHSFESIEYFLENFSKMISFTEKMVKVPYEVTNEKGKTSTYYKDELKYTLTVKIAKEDFVKLRRKTTGIYRNEFGDVTLIDTGGQTNERKKWKNGKISNLMVVLNLKNFVYFVALSEFDQNCYENEEENRMICSLRVFSNIYNNELKNEPIYLVFTKLDVFKEKIQEKDLSNLFPEYKDGKDAKKAMQFIESLYQKKVGREITRVYYLNCLDREQVVKTFYEIALKAKLE